MANPGHGQVGPTSPAPAEIFSVDAYCRSFGARVTEVDPDGGRLVLDRTAFYPGGGGQPHDLGTLSWAGSPGPGHVERVARDAGRIWHWLDGPDLPATGSTVHGDIDWGRRYLLMRTHTALHILCGVMWADYQVAVTGGNMEPGEGRLDFELDGISAGFGHLVEARVNEEIGRGLDIRVDFIGREAADEDPALVRTKATLIPRVVDPLRVIDIVGLDRQADGGTHVANTAEVGHVTVVKTESKGRANKRIRIRLD
jgi:misacylated tRNA(Ala) deacylase